MFSLRVVAQYNTSGRTFDVNVGNLPDVDVLEVLSEYLMEKYGVAFPAIPEFCEDPPLPTIADSPSSAEVEPPLLQATSTSAPISPISPSSVSSPLLSTVASGSSSSSFSPLDTKKPYHLEKKKCKYCGKQVSKSNFKRHVSSLHLPRSPHFKCDYTSCTYSTTRKYDLARHAKKMH